METRLIDAYRKLLLGLGEQSYPELSKPKDVVIFNALQGKKYLPQRELMIVGRAPNGWDVYYNPTNPNKENEVEKALKKLQGRPTNFDLSAEITNWEKKKPPYFISKSRFWNVGVRIAGTFAETKVERPDYIVYSNLYKVSTDGHNPTPQLMLATQENCINVLKTEIEIFQPKRILFLTGYADWAKPFIEALKIDGKENLQSKEVQFVGKYGSTEVVVAVHPQGKGKGLTDAIRSAFISII